MMVEWKNHRVFPASQELGRGRVNRVFEIDHQIHAQNPMGFSQQKLQQTHPHPGKPTSSPAHPSQIGP